MISKTTMVFAVIYYYEVEESTASFLASTSSFCLHVIWSYLHPFCTFFFFSA